MNYATAMKEKIEHKGKKILEEGKEMTSDAELKAYELGGKAKQAFSSVEGYAKDGSDYLESQVKSSPLLSIATAFVAGVILGKITSLK
jgi:ElaB/YqjD/DUF883 family membrane-anchored ribosome-binding protein